VVLDLLILDSRERRQSLRPGREAGAL